MGFCTRRARRVAVRTQCSGHSVFRAGQRQIPPAFQGNPRKQLASRFTYVMRLQVAAGWGTARGPDDLNIKGAGCGPGCRCSGGCAIAAGALMQCAPIAAAGLSGTVSRPGCQTPWGADLPFASKRLPPALPSANIAAICSGHTPTRAMAGAVRPPPGPPRPRRRRQGEGCQPLQRLRLVASGGAARPYF